MKILFILCLGWAIEAHIFYDLGRDEYDQAKNSRDFTGKVVLVTGSDSGIGKGITELFAALGAQTVVTGRSALKVSQAAKDVLALSPQNIKPLEVVADLTVDADAERLVKETIKSLGRIDVLVNNAGMGAIDVIEDNSFVGIYDQVFRTDLRSAVLMNHLSVPYLEATNGSIVHISSVAGIRPAANGVTYAMAKSAMNMLTQCLALELGPRGVRVNTISPGLILTEALANATDVISTTIIKLAIISAPLKRMGHIMDIAKGAVFLASSDASFITGANLVIDGGLVYNYPFANLLEKISH